MLPDILKQILELLGDKFTPAGQKQFYVDYIDVWELYLSLFELDKTRIIALLQKHDGENDPQYALRQQLAAVFNYVPSIVRMVVNYIYTEQPQLDIADERLQAFVADCDGSGTSLIQYIRQNALPMAMVFGWTDTLVQNPATPEGLFITAADQQTAAGGKTIGPVLFSITPIQRIDWSTKSSGEYNWIRFIDYDDESDNPFLSNILPAQSYITISGSVVLVDGQGQVLEIKDGNSQASGFWLRSWQLTDEEAKAQGGKAGDWQHDGGFLPSTYPTISTLYYVKSLDHRRRHFGLSKISMIALLTIKIIQLLSWTDEDVLANLAVFVFPGEKPLDKDGNPVEVKLTPFSVIWLGKNATIDPRILQGTTTNIEIKIKIIETYIQEILRLAYILGASGSATQASSGVQEVVIRNELFMELSDLSGALDVYTRDVLRHAATWITGTSLTADEFQKKYNPTVNFFKGPYAVDALKTMIENTQGLIDIYDGISPTMVQSALRQLAQTALYNEDDSRETIFQEIQDNADVVTAERQRVATALADSIGQSGADPAAADAGTITNPPGGAINPVAGAGQVQTPPAPAGGQ